MRKPSDREANEGVFRVDPEYGEMAVRIGGAVWNIEALSQREKALLCLMMDICDHNLVLAFQMHIAMALANSVPLNAIKEIIPSVEGPRRAQTGFQGSVAEGPPDRKSWAGTFEGRSSGVKMEMSIYTIAYSM